MANKKLKLEVELDTAKAKRQAREFEESTGGGSGGYSGAGSAASSLAKALSKASKSAESSGASFEKMNGSAARLTKGFAGIAVGMATSYASNFVKDPNAKAGLDYAGSGISGAVGGAMVAGLPGAIVGGLAGVLKTYMEKEGERSAMSKDFETGEAIYSGTRRDEKKFNELATTKEGTDIGANLAEVKKIIDNYTKTAADFVEQIRGELEKSNPDKELLEKLKRNLGYSRQQISKYEGLQKSLESIQDKHDTSGKAFYSGTDSLMKIGGGNAGKQVSEVVAEPSTTPKKTLPSISFSVPTISSSTSSFGTAFSKDADPAIKQANDRIERIDSEQLEVLKEIAQNMKQKGVSSWQ